MHVRSQDLALPMALSALRKHRADTQHEIEYATHDSAVVMFDVMGLKKSMDQIPMLLQPGVLSLAWGSVVRPTVAGLAFSPQFDGVEEMYVRAGAGVPQHCVGPYLAAAPPGPALEVLARPTAPAVAGTRDPAARGPESRGTQPRPAGQPRRALLRHGHSPEHATGTTNPPTGRHCDAHRQRDPHLQWWPRRTGI